MPSLAEQRCLNHEFREAAARCPECGRFYCRECITEHAERVVCASCLKKMTTLLPAERSGFTTTVRLLQCSAGLLLVWLFFFLLGQALLALPASFHEGTLWSGGG